MARREDPSRYVADSSTGRGGTLFVVDEAQEALRQHAKLFPGQFARALNRLGAIMRKEIRAAMESGGPPGRRWAPVVKWGERRPEKSSGRRKRKSKYSGSARNWLEAHFFRETRTGKPYGRLYSAGRYLPASGEKLVVQVGWVTDSSARVGKKVQAALRGIRNQEPRFDESQPVTRAMRRALAAGGVILSKSKRELRQSRRPLMRDIYQDFEPRIERIVTEGVAKYIIEGKTS